MYLPGFHVGDWGKAAAVAAIVAGIVCVGEAAWIHAKAALAQALIGAAWRRELAGSPRTQPWPWADTRPLARLTLRVETITRRDVDFVVTSIRIVDSRRARIALGAEQPRLTLVTCYPFDALV